MEHLITLTKPSVISALLQKRDHKYRFEKHIHKTFELYQILSGTCYMEIGNQTITCETNDVILIMPNVVHSFFLTNDDLCEFNHIHFSPAFFSQLYISTENEEEIDLITATILENNSFYRTTCDKRLKNLISLILEDQFAQFSLANAYTNLHITELLLYILEKSKSTIISARSSTQKNMYVSFTINYIQTHFSEKILISDIANALNISTRYLSKIFFEHMNVTIGNYINIYKMNQAIELMQNTDLSLTEISSHIGLKDSQHFSKLFSNIIGISPYKYKKMLHNID